MRLSIVGPTGSGKTTLAKDLSNRLEIGSISTDYLLFRHIEDKSRIKLEENEWRRELKEIFSKKSWIIEGVNPIEEVFKSADLIIYMRLPFHIALFRQWKRYLTDPVQRKEHGFANNLKLSRSVIKQYFAAEDLTRSNDPHYKSVKRLDRILGHYKEKLVIVKEGQEVEDLLDRIVLV